MTTVRGVGLVRITENEARNPEIREGWHQYWEDQRIQEGYIVETRMEVRLTRSTIRSRCKVGLGQDDVNRDQPMTW